LLRSAFEVATRRSSASIFFSNLATIAERDRGRSASATPLLKPSTRVGHDHRPIFSTAGEHGPSDTSQLVGQCDRQHVAVEPLRYLLDPGARVTAFGLGGFFRDATLSTEPAAISRVLSVPC
jgi:hypothetical protein